MAVDEVRPGYKRTEVGIIPEDWEVRTIGDSQPFVTSGSRGWARYYSDHGAPMVRITNLKRGSIRLDTEQMRYVTIPACSAEGARTSLENGDILVSITADIGIIGYVDSSLQKPAYINQHIALVRLRSSEIHPQFVSYFVASAPVQTFFRAITDAGAKAGLNLPTVRSIPFALPPRLLEQQLISQALSEVQITCETFERLIAKKRDLKQAVMQELLSGRNRLPGFEEPFLSASYGDLFEFLPTSANPRAQLDPYGEVLYVHYGDVHTSYESHLDFSRTASVRIDRKLCPRAASLKNGDWIMADASEDLEAVGKSVEVVGLPVGRQAVSGLHTFLLRERRPTFAPGFKGYLGKLASLHSALMKVTTGTKVYGVPREALKQVYLRYPPTIEEQTAITLILTEMDREIAALQGRLAKYREMKQGMMQNLLTGAFRLV
jgi:type I restriction enzyme S subunit